MPTAAKSRLNSSAVIFTCHSFVQELCPGTDVVGMVHEKVVPSLRHLNTIPWHTLAHDENRQEKHVETAEVYQCSICKLRFREKSLQQQCEAWCRTHNSCHLHIASQSQEAQKIARVKLNN